MDSLISLKEIRNIAGFGLSDFRFALVLKHKAVISRKPAINPFKPNRTSHFQLGQTVSVLMVAWWHFLFKF